MRLQAERITCRGAFPAAKRWRWMAAAVALLFAHGAFAAANGCSPYSNQGGFNGKTWFNEYYFGSAANNYLEIFSKNGSVNQSNPAVWNNWHISVYAKSGNSVARETYRLNSNTTACTISGGRTYLTHASRALDLNYNDAMVVVFDGPPDDDSSREIDAFVYSNASPPLPYNDLEQYYSPTCPSLKASLDAQLASASRKSTFKGQNLLILGNFGNKDNARLPDGTGNWDETTESGSGTTFTHCITNDPVDLVKSFTWEPAYPAPTSSGTVDPGAVLTFTVSAKNATVASMTGIQVTDTLPEGLSLVPGTVSASGGASAACTGTPATCVLTAPATLPPGATVSMSFQATATAAGVTIQNTAVQSGGTTLSPPPSADAFVTVRSRPVNTAGRFNACHDFALSGCSRSGGRLLTRLAASPFTTEIAALGDDGAVDAAYVGSGGAAKTVTVELVDAANADAVIASQDIVFPANDTTGHVTAAWPALNAAYRELRVRMTEAGAASPASAISGDSFSVRPPALTISTTASAAAESSQSAPVIKAGAAFTITATTSPAANYAGTVRLDPGRLATANVRVGNLYAAGTTNPFSVQANANAANNAIYDEVGYFYAGAGAFRDDAFTSVDRNAPAGCDPAATCDCISSPADGSNPAAVADTPAGNPARYGCSVGNKTAVSFARFIPDHFAVDKDTLAFAAGHPDCGFTYMDQPFTLSAGIEARNKAGARTQNYAGAFANGEVTVQMQNGGVAVDAARLNPAGAPSWSNGLYLFSADRFMRLPGLAAADGPYDSLAIGVRVHERQLPPSAEPPLLHDRDMDNSAAGCTPDAPGTSGGTCSAVKLATAAMRFGRLRLSNAYGSELLALPVPMKVEHYKTGVGWITNKDDSCTRIKAGNILLKDHAPAAFAPSGQAADVAFSAGTARFILQKPSPAPAIKSSVTACVDLDPPGAPADGSCTAPSPANMPWLQGRWRDTRYDDDPFARATFGVYKSAPLIYMREVY